MDDENPHEFRAKSGQLPSMKYSTFDCYTVFKMNCTDTALFKFTVHFGFPAHVQFVFLYCNGQTCHNKMEGT